jgi:group I intron endonuclease
MPAKKYFRKTSAIYCFKNILNRKIYVGQSSHVERRYLRHLNDLRKGIHPAKVLQAAWDKYGENNFEFKILEECEIPELDEKEIYYIKELHSHVSENGYNISWGGNAPMKNVKITNEHREKLSKASSGKRNGMYGKRLSKETLEKMSKSLTGHPVSEEQKRKLALTHCGRKRNSDIKYETLYCGVTKNNRGGFVARIANAYTGKRLYLGYFKIELDAAIAFDEKSWELYHDIGKLNFPQIKFYEE